MSLKKIVEKRWREARVVVRGLLSTRHVVLAHIIPTRRCNLACTYCNEYDSVSDPVPTDTMLARIDRLAELGTSIITISGGEPLLHPEIEAILRRIRERGAIAGMITNGYLLSPEKIRGLNSAGLEYLQISVDNLVPDEVSLKSLKVLDRKLRHLAEHASFNVSINSVLGGGIKRPQDALAIARRAVELGFASSVGIIHDGSGALKPLNAEEQGLYEQIKRIGKKSHARLNGFQRQLVAGKPNAWRCRAGGRYLYVCEDGLVHYCSQQRGYPAIPLEDYTLDDVQRGYESEKACAPTCTVGCVQQVAMLDNWRSPQQPHAVEEHPRPRLEPEHRPRPVREAPPQAVESMPRSWRSLESTVDS